MTGNMFRCGITLLLAIVRAIMSTSPISDQEQAVRYTKIDVKLMRTYEDSLFAVTKIQVCRSLTRIIKARLKEMMENPDNMPLVDHFPKHYHYAIRIGDYGGFSEVFVAIYVKFLSFLNGIIFINCAIFEGKGYTLKEGACKNIAWQLLGFASLGLTDLNTRFAKLMDGLGPNYLKERLKDTVGVMVMAIQTMWSEFQCLFLGKTPPNQTQYPRLHELYNRARTTGFYNRLKNYEESIMYIAARDMLTTFEYMKSGEPIKDDEIIIRRATSIEKPDAEHLWKRADYFYDNSSFGQSTTGNTLPVISALIRIEIAKLKLMRAPYTDVHEVKTGEPVDFELSFDIDTGTIAAIITDIE